jgi:hypothetical protein
MEKFPSISVAVPWVVPLMSTLTPGIVSVPSADLTVPLTTIDWAIALIGSSNVPKMRNKTKNELTFFGGHDFLR